MPTTTIGTEDARASLTQRLENLYETVHAGGAYNAKEDIVSDGSRNEMVNGVKERTHTTKGFKTKMREGQSEMKMVNDGTITTAMLTSINGPHSTKKYWNM